MDQFVDNATHADNMREFDTCVARTGMQKP